MTIRQFRLSGGGPETELPLLTFSGGDFAH